MPNVIDLPATPVTIGHDEPLYGENVVVHRMQGDHEAGQLLELNRLPASLTIRSARNETVIVFFSNLRYLLFTKPITPLSGGHPLQHHPGTVSVPVQPQPFQIVFRNDKALQGHSQCVLRDDLGLHLFINHDNGIVRVFVPHQAVKTEHIGAPVGEVLAGRGQIDPALLQEILREQAQQRQHLPATANGVSASSAPSPTPAKIGEMLTRKGLVTDENLHRALAEKFGLPFIQLQHCEINPEALECFPGEFARQYRVLPVSLKKNRLFVAMEDPTDTMATSMLSFVTGKAVDIAVAARLDIEEAIDKHYGVRDHSEALDEIDLLATLGQQQTEEMEKRELEDLSKQKPIVRLVNNILLEAIHRGASDIHIRPEEDDVSLLIRVDGTLLELRRFSKTILRAVVSRIKVMGRMDVTVRRLPQDGNARIQAEPDAGMADLRISVMPTVNGESVVIRILKAQAGLKNIGELGFSEPDRIAFSMALQKNNGLILVTGPTGSGKSTTLYAALHDVIERNVSIITVEDPVEYRILGTEQVQVNATIGLTFARVLRNILRHDPDVIMVGEIRDRETAQIAVESALTGHLVLSTLHTNDAATTLTRLLEMGIDPFLINSTLLLVIAQRLVRRNCPECLMVEEVNPFVRQSLDIGVDEVFYKGQGCDPCNGLGYRGRTAVYELLQMTPALRQTVSSTSNSDTIQQLAIEAGMQTLTTHALSLARRKLIALGEVNRIRIE